MQIVVTSYRRLAYLQRTIESLRQDDVRIYIVDGGSDAETIAWIKKNANGWLLFRDNPGADFLKTEGIKQFITDREFLLTSDDLLFPPGYSSKIMANYLALNDRYPVIDWTFCACSMPHQGIADSAWQTINGVECLPCKTSQVSGAIIDTAICRRAGYFPNYGRSGQGDFAFNRRLEERGIRRCYWRSPSIVHIGENKPRDYPELHLSYLADKRKHMKHGRLDDGVLTSPGKQSAEFGLR